MIYLASIYVACSVIHLTFTMWRDLTETKRRHEFSQRDKEAHERAKREILEMSEHMAEMNRIIKKIGDDYAKLVKRNT